MTITEEQHDRSAEDLEALDHLSTISRRQGEAWKLANLAYHVPDGEAFREKARELYFEDLQARLAFLFARGDEQNDRLDELDTQEPSPTG